MNDPSIQQVRRTQFDQGLEAIRGCLEPSFRRLSRPLESPIPFLTDLVDKLSQLSDRVRTLDEFLAFYAEKSAEALGEFLHSEACQALFVKRNLAARTMYLNGHLGIHIDSTFTSGVEKGDYHAAVMGIQRLYEATKTLRELGNNWSDFRETMALGLEEIEAATLNRHYFDELSHGIHTEIYPEGTDREFQLSLWPGVMSNLKVDDRLSEWLKALFQGIGWAFDTICTLSASAMPLVAHLALKVKADWIACDNNTLKFTRLPGRNERVLLLDTLTDTGFHFLAVKQNVEKATGIPIVGFFCLVHNDMKHPSRGDGEEDIREIDNFIYLYEVSELYQVWKAKQGRPRQLAVGVEEEKIAVELRSFAQDATWIDENFDTLRTDCPNQYVAVFQKQRVDTARDVRVLIARLKGKYPDQWHQVAIRYIPAEDSPVVAL